MSLELSGLQGHAPIGFMAAVGLLRIAPAGTRLAWHPATQVAELHGIDRDALLAHLLSHMAGRANAPELQLADDVRKFSVSAFRAAYDMAPEPVASWVRAWWRIATSPPPPSNCKHCRTRKALSPGKEPWVSWC